MSGPRTPDGPGRFEVVRGEDDDPPELQLLLRPLGDDPVLRERMSRAYYRVMEGAPGSHSVQLAILISGLVNATKANAAPSVQIRRDGNQAPSPEKLETLRRDIVARLEQAFRDADDNRLRQTDEIKRTIREALPERKWYHRKDWLAALAMLLFATGFVGGFWLTWPLATDRAHAEAMARISALTSALKGQ